MDPSYSRSSEQQHKGTTTPSLPIPLPPGAPPPTPYETNQWQQNYHGSSPGYGYHPSPQAYGNYYTAPGYHQPPPPPSSGYNVSASGNYGQYNSSPGMQGYGPGYYGYGQQTFPPPPGGANQGQTMQPPPPLPPQQQQGYGQDNIMMHTPPYAQQYPQYYGQQGSLSSYGGSGPNVPVGGFRAPMPPMPPPTKPPPPQWSDVGQPPSVATPQLQPTGPTIHNPSPPFHGTSLTPQHPAYATHPANEGYQQQQATFPLPHDVTSNRPSSSGHQPRSATTSAPPMRTTPVSTTIGHQTKPPPPIGPHPNPNAATTSPASGPPPGYTPPPPTGHYNPQQQYAPPPSTGVQQQPPSPYPAYHQQQKQQYQQGAQYHPPAQMHPGMQHQQQYRPQQNAFGRNATSGGFKSTQQQQQRNYNTSRPPQNPEQRAAVAINKRMTSAHTAREIFDIVAQEHAAFDTICLATAIHRLANIKGAPNLHEEITKAPEFHKLKQLILDRRSEFTCRNISNTLWSFAKMNYFPGQDFMQKMLEGLTPKLAEGNAQNVANLVWSCATLSFNPGDEILSALAVAIKDKVSEFTSQNISNSVISFAKLDYNPDEDVLDALASEAIQKISSFSAQALSNTLWGLSKMGIKNEKLFAAIGLEASARTRDFNSQNIGNILWAMANLGFNPGEDVLADFSKWTIIKINEFTPQNLVNVVWSFAKLGVYDEKLFNAAQDKGTQIMHTFAAQSISNFLWSFATLDQAPEKHFLDAACVKAASMLETFTPQNLSNTCWALATLKEHDTVKPFLKPVPPPFILTSTGYRNTTRSGPTFYQIVSQEILRRLSSPEEEADFSRQHLANYLWSVATLDLSIGDNAMQLITRSLGKRFKTCIPQEIANAAWACARLGYYDANFTSALCEETVERIDEFGQQNLSNLAWACSKLSHYDQKLMNSVSKRAIELASELSFLHITQLIYAFARLKHDSPDFLRMVLEQYPSRLEGEPLAPQYITNLLWSMAIFGGLTRELWDFCMGHLFLVSGRPHDLPEETLGQLFQVYLLGVAEHGVDNWPIDKALMEAAQTAWQKGAKIVTISEFHSEVARMLGSMGEHISIEKLTEDGMFSVDIAIDKDHIAVEVDGPHHFTANTLRPLGEMFIRKRLLEARRWTVVSVPFFSWSGLTSEERRLYLQRLLNQARAGTVSHPTDVEDSIVALGKKRVSDGVELGGEGEEEDRTAKRAKPE